MFRLPPYLLCLVLIVSCNDKKATPSSQNKVIDLTQHVNPFIGTSKMGHVFPGATTPFGMVQLSPQTHMEVMYDSIGNYNPLTYEYCAGYQYKDSTIIGFSHTNFSGTGHSDLGDFLIMPTTGNLNLEPLRHINGQKGFYSTFSHDKESAEPGYYQVDLDSYGIKAELTASPRVGFHQYTFPNKEQAHIILDMMYNVYHHDQKNVWTFIRVENDSLITGYRQTKGWARTRKVFFALSFSKPFKSYGHKKYDKKGYNGFYRRFEEDKNFPEMAGKDIRAYFDFDVNAGEKIQLKMALSNVSTQGALKNLEAEIAHWNFNQIKNQAKADWNLELSKIKVDMLSKDQLTTFYTALYHTNLSPIIYEDVDGNYRGLDQNIHQSDGFTNYTIFSLWDTYRALHPLFNLTQPQRNNEMIKSMLAHQEQSVHGMLPIWSHYANENWCMIGYHATSIIADAMVKNIGDFDQKQALNASVTTANVDYFEGIGDYKSYKYVPEDKSLSSVSKTLEYAYNDWCIAQMAKQLKQSNTQKSFEERADYYKNVFDASIGFMRPRLSSGEFKTDFDAMDTHGQGFIEGNAWNYGLYVPHDIKQMIELKGGKEQFSLHLDSLFTMEIDDKFIEKTEDITRDGIIGNYVHGNEPGHHIPYLYNWTNDAHKTQARVRMIMDRMYGPTVEGLCGNDDAGQMSAWYIFSALGFYPVTPGSPFYDLGSPLVKEARITLSNGNTITITANNQSENNIYVSEVKWNGKTVNGLQLNHNELTNGGELVFEMSKTPRL
ncbi:GH92 family glycosyl hydrolase [Sediminicola luteus]|uniref:Sugar hydrolase n=1 Tax=Sediminicola luteus TaxID=319238 RepID=A0A2A4G8C4_9FLAO|nr:GH92 family glycosyl hydrolase [Sediminicola luteus]PCE64877.1 sugar hydrolase [Sediminicola luteus]